MENLDAPASLPGEEITLPAEGSTEFPPKYLKPEPGASLWLRSLLSLALYLILGYYIFPVYEILLLITCIIIIHELGHFAAMKYYRYKDLGIFFIPLLGAYVSGSKREVSQRESAVILLAGPLPGIVIGIVLYLLSQSNPAYNLFGISFYTMGLLFILLNGVNLLPVYPLDGGQLLNRVFLDEESWLSKLFVWASIAFLVWLSLFGGPRPFYPLLLFPLLMIVRQFGDNTIKSLEKKIQESGMDMDRSYEELPDEDYWKIRAMVIAEHPAFKDVEPGPPYVYHTREEKMMAVIQGLLHRHLLQDLTLAGKIFILLLWAAALASPWLLDMDMRFFRRFGF